MASKTYAFSAHGYTRNLFTAKNLEVFLGGRRNLKRAMKVTRLKPSRDGYFSENQARALIVAHRGGLYDLIYCHRRM
jgi:hypothetical protein